jgi:hypothetical protein
MSFLFGCSKRSGPQRASQVFSELSQEDGTRLDRQRHVVAAIAKQRYGTEGLTKTKSDLPVLQRLLDDGAFSKAQTYELQSLGIVFGDVLATELPLRWMMVTDEIGSDLTLRYKNTTIQINAVTMISKRVERGETVDVETLFAKVPESIAQMEKEFQK